MNYLITSILDDGKETKKIEKKETYEDALVGYHKTLAENINAKDEVVCIVIDDEGNIKKSKNWRKIIDDMRFFSVKTTTTTNGGNVVSMDSYPTLEDATIQFHDNMQRLIGKSNRVMCMVINSSCGVHECEKWEEESEEESEVIKND